MSTFKDAEAVLQTSLPLLQQGEQEKFTDYFKHFSPHRFTFFGKFLLYLYLSSVYIFHVIQRVFRAYLCYPIEGEISSPATRVIFTRSMRTNEQICLKVWLPCKNGVYDTKDMARCTSYLVEGFEFNRQFAQDVYLGIAPVELYETLVRRGRLINNPKRDKLKPDLQYALIMRRLAEAWRLDHQLHVGSLGTIEGMEFLAKEVARMHRKLIVSPRGMGKSDHIAAKLILNRRLFEEGLDELTQKRTDIKKYMLIGKLMDQASKIYTQRFEQRYENGHIKRCHGDLKAVNLWIRPVKSLFPKQCSQELLALDCVDFNPEFCHIDTLSDIAMLAIDLEMRLTNWPGQTEDKQIGKKLTKHFLDTYLREVGENKTVWPLLEYYMTEKAMVCAYMSILYDGLPTLGEKYLNIALVHAQRLEKLLIPLGKLPLSKKKAVTVLVVTPDEAIQDY